VEISKDGWQSSNYVIIVSGENFPDALCSTPLAKRYDAPILLTQSGAVSEAAQGQLKGINVTYKRKKVSLITMILNKNVHRVLQTGY
jgi:putative cell wall-binding protein